MLFVKLDTNWADNPKVIAAGLDGAGLHAMALCLAKRTATDGVLHRTQLARLGGTPDLIDRLVDVGLLDDMDDGRLRVHDWLSFNPSNEALSKAAREGNHKRWRHPGPVRSCTICSPGDPQAIAPASPPDPTPTDHVSPGESPSDRPPIAQAIATRSGAESEAIGESETETEGETEKTTSSPSATNGDDPLRGFDQFWTAWPARAGKKLARGKAEIQWRRLSLEARRAAYRGAVNYAAACAAGSQGAMDAFRWLRDHGWDDWQEPATPARTNGRVAAPDQVPQWAN